MYQEPTQNNGSAENDHKITSSGGSALNTAVFVQNVQQLRRLLSPTLCSVIYQESEAAKKSILTQLPDLLNNQLSDLTGLNMTSLDMNIMPPECDKFVERKTVDKVPIVLLIISIVLQLAVGLFHHGEAIFFRLFRAEVYQSYSKEANDRAIKKRMMMRTIAAVLAFVIAVLTMIIGAFQEE